MATTNESIPESTTLPPVSPPPTEPPDQPIANSAELQEAALTTELPLSTTVPTDTPTTPLTVATEGEPAVTSIPSDDLFKVDFANSNVPKQEADSESPPDLSEAPEHPIGGDIPMEATKTSTTSMTGSSDSYVMVAEATPSPPQTITESQILEEVEPKSKPEPVEEEWLDILGNGSLKKLLLEKGSEVKPTRGQRVVLDLTGHLHQMDGVVVEEQKDLEVELGETEVVQGLDLAVPLMTLGEVSWLFMVSRFGYGETGNGTNIPGNVDLYYMVKLKEIFPRYDYENMEEDKMIEMLEKKKLRGNNLYKLKQFPLAISVYNSAFNMLNSNPYVNTPDGKNIGCRLLTNLAIAQYKVDNLNESLSSCDKALTLVPQDTKALYRKSVILTERQEYEDSIRCLEQALAYSPEDKLVDQELKRVRGLNSQSNRRQRDICRRMIQGSTQERIPQVETGGNSSGKIVVLIASGVVAITAVCLGLLLFKKT